MNFTRNDTDLVNPFPSLAGKNSVRSWNTNIGYVLSRGTWTNNVRFNYNRNNVSVSNLFTFLENVVGEAGIGSVSQDPFDFGLPTLNFTNFAGLNDPASQQRLDQAFTFSDFASWTRGRHTLRFGGDYRRILQDLRADRNARGSFTFTGFATAEYVNGQPVPDTGYDFADFLLGLPQLTSLQSGTTSYNFHANTFDLFLQDDWRALSKLTLNFGLRYEYNGPYTEAHNRIVNLDVAPDFTAVAPVQPGQPGPFTGKFPLSLVQPDRNNFAPRFGIAWRPFREAVFRAGYGINYNLAQYANIIQALAFQPPFAITSTNVSSLADPLTLQKGFPGTSPGNITNNFAVDRNYRLGYVQIWNLDLQFTLPGNIVLSAGYNGAKATHLDLERAPNRGPSGLLIPGVQAFLFESSEANSILHAATLRARKRFSHGFSIAGSYTFSKSIDNASSIGGGAVVVAQNDLDLAAERGLSSFDQRHRFTGNWVYELPFGPTRRYLRGGTMSRVLNSWQWSGDITIASGLPFTARILGNFADVARGTNGTLRADYTGAPISVDDPTVREWFNTAAFAVPPAGSFGNAARNTIEGPGQITFNMALSKTIQFKEPRSLELRAQANNIFNTVQFISIDAVVNSPTYGQVISAGAMRRMQLLARFRF